MISIDFTDTQLPPEEARKREQQYHAEILAEKKANARRMAKARDFRWVGGM